MGKVFLVGAGLGSIELLTLRGKALLEQAEVVIYDALADRELLTLVSASCHQIYVGKRGGQPSMPQSAIDQLLVDYARRGKRVVRLKGGDPFIFGRSHSEIVALNKAGCPFEVVPGISSVLAAPLLAGIPLTHKTLGNSFGVVTAHDLDALDWLALGRLDTVVLLMGGRNLVNICRRFQAQGRSPDFPIAIVRAAGHPEQQVWQGTLSTIIEQTAGVKLSPCVMIVGQVVNLREDYMPTGQPLQGKTILVTRAATQSSEFSQMLQELGARVLEMPALEIREPSTWEPLDQAIATLGSYQWLILTSANGVEFFFNRLHTLGKDVRALGHLKIAVVGKKTAKFLRERGIKADFIPSDYVADALVEDFPEAISQQKILFPRVETGGRDVLVKQLGEKGATVIEVPAYESGCPQAIEPKIWQALQEQNIHILTFASSKTVRNFWKLVQQQGGTSDLLKSVAIASIGPQTSQTCQDIFGRVDIEAQQYTLEGLRDAILNAVLANEIHAS